jgi:hypothetical protein
MSGPSHKSHPTASEYSAAVARLAQARDTIELKFKAASDGGNLVEGKRLFAELQKEFAMFTAFRDGIPAAARLSINAERILESFCVDDKGFVNLVIPPDISDQDAMHALNSKFRELFPDKKRAAIWEEHIERILSCGDGYSTTRSGRREIKVIGVVDGTVRKNRENQGKVLTQKGLVFSHPIDQALAAAAFACRQQGDDLFEGNYVRGSVPGFALGSYQSLGVRVRRFNDEDDISVVAASGSPFAELKNNLIVGNWFF